MAGVAALTITASLAASPSSAVAADHAQIKHVLLISVDGMHQSDLAWYVANHPHSELARLATGGAEYTHAQTADPSDSDPGGTALMSGGDPKVTGIYYDDEYSHDVFPPGTTKCSGPVPGGNVIYDSPDDKLPAVPDLLHNGSGNTFPSFDEGGSIYPGGKDTNPALITNLTSHPQSGLNPATYPVDPQTCKPIQPWDFPGQHDLPGDPQRRHAHGVV
jgi:Type I phosphodiesterase / nucleotide pyrophosphatase